LEDALTLIRASVIAALIVTAQVAAAAAEPSNLTASVTGTTVSFNWTGDDAQWVLEAGSSPGLSNLASIQLPTPSTSYVVPNVPFGTYYVRVRGVRLGVAGVASNEVVVVVGATGCMSQGRVDLRSSAVGSLVSLDWNFSGTRPFAWRVEVGSSPGLSDLALIDVAGDLSQFQATAAPGAYYVRLRRKSSCEPSSNEVVIQPGVAGAQECVLTLPPAGLIASPGQVVSVVMQMPSGCTWVAEPQEAWITLQTTQGIGGESLRFMINTAGGDSGQIPVRTTSGRYLIQVFQR
jgi:hypothetical protein